MRIETFVPPTYGEIILRNVPNPVTGELEDRPIRVVETLGSRKIEYFNPDGSPYAVETWINGIWKFRRV